jgi:hypothetical protein
MFWHMLPPDSWVRRSYRLGKNLFRYGPSYVPRRYLSPRAILGARPRVTAAEGPLTVCVLTSRKDWLCCLCALVTYYEFTERTDPLLIYSDGSLTARGLRHIRRLFPSAQLADRDSGAAVLAGVLARYPNCWRYREQQPCAARIIDFPALCRSKFILMLDSDVLFFRRPDELLRHLNVLVPGRFVFHRDCQESYVMDRHRLAAEFGCQIDGQINVGVMLADVSGFRYDCLEDWLSHSAFMSHPWSEQTLWAMYASRHEVKLLSADYLVKLGPGIQDSTVLKHYVKPVRELLYVEGLPLAARALRARGALPP